MKPLQKHLRRYSHILSFESVRIFGVLARTMSRRQAERLAFLLGDLLFDVVRVRRQLVFSNLTRTFPEKTLPEIGRIARKVYRNLALSLFEVLRLPLIRTRDDAAALVDVDAGEICRIKQGHKKGMVIVSAHYGNWELLTICFGLLVTPVTMIVKSQKNKLIDQQINSWRTMHGNRIVYKGQALREGLRTLEQGGTLAILGDQSDPGAGFFVDFLGRKASLFLGPAFFALKARVPLFVAMSRKHGDGRYTIELKEIDTSDLVFSRNDIRELAQRYTRVIEYYIRQCPEEWLWLHDRWKRADP